MKASCGTGGCNSDKSFAQAVKEYNASCGTGGCSLPKNLLFVQDKDNAVLFLNEESTALLLWANILSTYFSF
jgi:hypothetical protein